MEKGPKTIKRVCVCFKVVIQKLENEKKDF